MFLILDSHIGIFWKSISVKKMHRSPFTVFSNIYIYIFWNFCTGTIIYWKQYELQSIYFLKKHISGRIFFKYANQKFYL